ncbi:MAG: DUF2304 domain-containing protein [Armatimonadota bacterium]
MTPSQRIIAAVASLILVFLIADLVRRRKLREEYSILWLIGGAMIFIVSTSDRAIFLLAKMLSIAHPAYALFVLAMFIGLMLSIHFTIVLSKLTAQNWRLTQEIALVKTELEEMKTSRNNV